MSLTVIDHPSVGTHNCIVLISLQVEKSLTHRAFLVKEFGKKRSVIFLKKLYRSHNKISDKS